MNEKVRERLVRTGWDLGIGAIILVLIWGLFVIWTRSRNGEIAYECVVFKVCPQTSEPVKSKE